MKSIQAYSDMTSKGRATALRSEVASLSGAQKLIAKILFAAEANGDFEEKETVNAFAQRITGRELRRECQGVYEAVNVLRAMSAGKVIITEEQFDKVRGFALVCISGLLSKQPGKVPRAVEIALSGAKDVVAQLRELAKKTPPAAPAKNAGGDSEPLKNNEIFPDLTDLNATTFTLPDSEPIFNQAEIMARFVSDIQGLETTEDCDTVVTIMEKLAEMAEARKAALESARADNAKPARGKDATPATATAPEQLELGAAA